MYLMEVVGFKWKKCVGIEAYEKAYYRDFCQKDKTPEIYKTSGMNNIA